MKYCQRRQGAPNQIIIEAEQFLAFTKPWPKGVEERKLPAGVTNHVVMCARGNPITIRHTEWIVAWPDGHTSVYTDHVFTELYTKADLSAPPVAPSLAPPMFAVLAAWPDGSEVFVLPQLSNASVPDLAQGKRDFKIACQYFKALGAGPNSPMVKGTTVRLIRFNRGTTIDAYTV